MARETLVLQVFVASPSDVNEERGILEDVIRQLNQTWSSNLGLTFELLKWETNVRPAFASDPQFSINEQIGNDYDVFIGIFWGRIGTSTPRADSGTLEEFENAFVRLKESGKTPEIMLYFKDAPIPPSKINSDQIRKVLDFKQSVSSRGGLYSVFEDEAGFESSLRAHLTAIAQSFASRTKSVSAYQNNAKNFSNKGLIIDIGEDDDTDDYGYIDYFEIYESRQYDMVSAINIINDATIRIGQQISQRTLELNAGIPSNAKDARRLIKRVADDIDNYSDSIRPQIAVLTIARESAFNALSNALALQGDFSNHNEDLANLRTMLTNLISGTNNATDGMTGMREAADKLPRISKEVNKAKRIMIRELDAFLAEVESTRSTVNNLVDAIDRMLEN